MKRPAFAVLAVFLASIAHAAAPDPDDAFLIPDGYVLQPLDPTGGKIGAPPNKWEQVKAVSDVMSVVEPIGPDFGR